MGYYSCPSCGYRLNSDGEQADNLQQYNMKAQPWGDHMPMRQGADHQGPITPQQKQVFAEFLIEQGRNEEVAAMMANPGMYADEWAQYLNKSTQPPEVDPAEQQPMPQVPPEQMGQMPVPPMSIPQPTGKTATNPRRCPECQSATTTPMNSDGNMRCHRCGHIWDTEIMEDSPVVKSHWIIKNARPGDGAAEFGAPNPVAAPAADATAPGDRAQQQDSTLSWAATDGTPLQVGQTYEMHNPNYPIPDVVKVEQVKPDSLVVTMVGEYNSPSDPQDANGPGYTHEIDLQEAQTEGLTFNPSGGEGEEEQSQDQAQQDGVGQTVNTEPVEQPHGDFPLHASVEDRNNTTDNSDNRKNTAVLPTDHCPNCEYTHVTSNYTSPTEVAYECFRCAHQWKVADEDEDSELNPESRAWIKDDDGPGNEIGFDPRALAMASSGQGRNIRDIAQRDPRNAEIRERLNANKTAGAKFSPREQREFIDEEGTARNADRLRLDGTHYVESAFDNSKANPDKVNDNYLGLGL
jgi:transcription initiation factor TFIIIB Brf1 subunit/transcription initiation factor TFIIB